VLCFGFDFGVVGLWTGLAAGLVVVAAILLRAWAGATQHVASIKPVSAHIAD
jgi:hypothetical protein